MPLNAGIAMVFDSDAAQFVISKQDAMTNLYIHVFPTEKSPFLLDFELRASLLEWFETVENPFNMPIYHLQSHGH